MSLSCKDGVVDNKMENCLYPLLPRSEKGGGGVLCYVFPEHLLSPSKAETFYTMPYDVSRINARALLRDVFRQRWMFYKEGDKDKRNRLAFLVLLNRPLDNR